jgi:hypothetical protein
VIVGVGGDWDTVAAANDAPELKGLRRSNLLDSITDPTLRELWSRVLVDVRAGQRMHGFDLRCDAPSLRRWITIVVEPQPEDGVSFSSIETRTEIRPYVGLLDRRVPRADELLAVCAWCAKVRTTAWVSVEDAVKQLGLFEDQALPTISHGICERCLAQYTDAMPAPIDAVAS